MRLILLLFLGMSSPGWAEGTVAFLGMHLLDLSQQNTLSGSLSEPEALEADLARLEKTKTAVAERFTQEGFALLDLGPVSAELERITNPANCYGCDLRMAKTLGADFILVGEIRKTSDALVSINLQLRDGDTGVIVKGGSASVRGNTDALWERGLRQILNNRFFREDEK